MRLEMDPDTAKPSFYALLTSLVVPRPIAWVSTRSAGGVNNLAPHSFFTVACVNPPILAFSSVGVKDTLSNINATGEFVVNFCPEALFEQVNATGTNFPAHISEFTAVGLTPAPSAKVTPPRVAESPAALECVLHSTIGLGDSTLVLGRVVHAGIEDTVLVDGLPAIEALAPLSRLGRNQWGSRPPVRAINRIPYEDWPGHYA